MTYQLYNRLGSGGFVVEAALTLAEAPFELITLDSKPGTPLPESFKQTNPWGQVPTLILPDGSIMTESAAILIYLAACYPEKGLGPVPGTPDYAQFLRWLVFANVNLYETILRRVYPFRYTTDPDTSDTIRSAAIQRMKAGLEVVETAIEGPFLLGKTLNVADVYLAMLFIWFRGEINAPRMLVLTDGVRLHPKLESLWRQHFGDR